MAFAYTKDGYTIIGNKRLVWGTYTNGSGDTGGDIDTSLSRVEMINLQHTGTAVSTGAPAINETLPMSSGVVTIVTDDNSDGIWFAIGR